MKTAAIDIGGTAIKYALFNGDTLEIKGELPSEGAKGREFIIKNLMLALSLLGDFDTIGISSAGQVDPVSGTIVYATDNIPFYTGTPLKDIVEQKFSKRVFVENDVNAAAVGESLYGAGRNENDFLLLTYGTGIGGAIMSDRHLYRGSRGVAAEFGHVLTHPNGRICTCGRHGCYEAYASATALVKNVRELDPKLDDGRKIFESLKRSNAAVQSIVDSWISEIAIGLYSLVYIFNPEKIIVGGGIMSQPYIVKKLKKHVSEFVMETFKNVNIVPAELGNNAGLYGMLGISTGKFIQ